MSVKFMALVWEHTELNQGETLVALALADHADDSGECWPSIERIAEKARLKRRQTQKVIGRLESLGIITVERRLGRTHTSRYRFTLSKGANSAPFIEPEKVQRSAPIKTEKVHSATVKGALASAPEPSVTIKKEPPYPPELDSAAWERWLDYRKTIRKPIKPVSMPAAQLRLAGFGADQAAVVEQSIANGWRGIFALKENGNGTSGNGGTKRLSAVERAQRATGGARF